MQRGGKGVGGRDKGLLFGKGVDGKRCRLEEWGRESGGSESVGKELEWRYGVEVGKSNWMERVCCEEWGVGGSEYQGGKERRNVGYRRIVGKDGGV